MTVAGIVPQRFPTSLPFGTPQCLLSPSVQSVGTYAFRLPTDFYAKRSFVMPHSHQLRKGQILKFLFIFLLRSTPSFRFLLVRPTTSRTGGEAEYFRSR